MSYDINSNIADHGQLSADQINDAVKGTGLAGLGQAFKDMEAKYNVNADFALAHAIIESAWGNSFFAQNRNNLFGLDAYDSNPNNASAYASKQSCIDYYGHFLSTYYLTPGAVYFNGATPHGVFVKYSSSHDSEAQSVVGIMNQLLAKEAVAPAPSSPAPAPSVGTVNSQVHVVTAGENLSVIAQHFGLSLARIEQLNPSAGHPAGHFDTIWPGDQINVSGATPPSVVTAGDEVDIQVPSGYDGYLSVIAAKYGTTVAELVSWNQGKYPSMTADYVQAGWTIRVR